MTIKIDDPSFTWRGEEHFYWLRFCVDVIKTQIMLKIILGWEISMWFKFSLSSYARWAFLHCLGFSGGCLCVLYVGFQAWCLSFAFFMTWYKDFEDNMCLKFMYLKFITRPIHVLFWSFHNSCRWKFNNILAILTFFVYNAKQ